MKREKILHLNLKKKWFDLIKNGSKNIEYRGIKPYWINRLFINNNQKEFDYIIFKNGYSKNAPTLKRKWTKTEFVDNGDLGNFKQIAIFLGGEI